MACEPMGPIPGGELAGEIHVVPDDWAAVHEVDTVQVETRPDAPYSINIWAVGLGKNFYIASGAGGESKWVEHLAMNSNVRLRIGKSIYELRAVRVDDQTELGQVRVRYIEKYGLGQDESMAAEAWIYRLDPR